MSSKEFTIRNIGKGIGDFLSNLFNAILDFDLTLIAGYGFMIFGFFFWPYLIYKWIDKDFKNWKNYHIGKKIMHPIVILLGIGFWFIFIWIIF